MVRPILEYGHAVWQPYQKTLSAELEDVQRRATRLLASMKDKPYPERLRALHLPSLEHRRLRGDMIEVYKYLHAFYNVDNPKFELADNSRRDLRGNPFKLTKSRFRLDIRGNFFSYRVVAGWNSLPDSVVTAPSLNSFKTRLDKYWENHPARFSPSCLE
ncbi:uncharacterized protein LOC143282247 [Babylonia areolata]|uniref:uncharacterized protein LOC143282247 n=1 Tax=Babylonia areolata TaxID=304850 RepID=UPI003FD57BBC